MAARGLTGGLDATDTPVAERLTPTGSLLDADSQDAPSSSPENSRRLQGAALRSAVEAIASLNVSEGGGNARSVIQLVEFADQLSADDFPIVLAMLGESGKAPHEAIRAELLAYWIDKDAIKARAYFTSSTGPGTGTIDWTGVISRTGGGCSRQSRSRQSSHVAEELASRRARSHSRFCPDGGG